MLLGAAFETDDFALRFQPIVERMAGSKSPLGVNLIGPCGNAGLQIITGRDWLTVNRFLLGTSRLSAVHGLGFPPRSRLFRFVRSHESILPVHRSLTPTALEANPEASDAPQASLLST